MAVEGDDTDQDLDFVRGIRKTVIGELLKKGVPEDKDSLTVLQHYLADMSKDALGKKRIKVDKQVGDKIAEAQSFIAALLVNPNVKKVGQGEGGTVPSMPDNIKPVTVLDGEFSIGIKSENYAQFMERTKT